MDGPLAELSGALKLNDVLAFICQIFSLHICSDYCASSILLSCFNSPLSVTSLIPDTLQTSLWVLGELLFCDAW